MNAVLSTTNTHQYRAVFISDTHLGTRGCRSDFLADFLGRMSCQHLFLVGDIVEGGRLRKSWFWDANHDEMFRAWLPTALDPHALEVAGIAVRNEATHVTADGKKLLVIHGDEFDSVVRYARFLAVLGDGAYVTSLVVNRWFNSLRCRMGYPY